ncbi:MAG TPA: VanZ family protein [Tepidisphaeraceae bacterium]|jgi:VanZ family protein
MSSSRTRLRLAAIVTAVYWLGILTLTHLPPTRLPETHVSDKLEHFVAYFILGILLWTTLRLLRPQWPISRITLIVVPILLAYGALDELTQPWSHRTCSLYDWYADASGAAAAAIVSVGVVGPLLSPPKARS